jgi:hypothetical protein
MFKRKKKKRTNKDLQNAKQKSKDPATRTGKLSYIFMTLDLEYFGKRVVHVVKELLTLSEQLSLPQALIQGL